MKKTAVPALVILALGLVIAIGSATFLGPCVHEDGGFGACHWAGRMLLGVGALLAALAALALIARGARTGLYLAMVPAAALGMLTPGMLIALCTMPTMRCRMVMRPALLLLCAAALIAALTGWLLSRRKAV